MNLVRNGPRFKENKTSFLLKDLKKYLKESKIKINPDSIDSVIDHFAKKYGKYFTTKTILLLYQMQLINNQGEIQY